MKLAIYGATAAVAGSSAYLHPIAGAAAVLLGACAALAADRRYAVAIVVVLAVAADAGLRVDAAPSWTPTPKVLRR